MITNIKQFNTIRNYIMQAVTTFFEDDITKKHRIARERLQSKNAKDIQDNQDMLDRFENDDRRKELIANREALRQDLIDCKSEVLDCEAFIQINEGRAFANVMNRLSAENALPILSRNVRQVQELTNNAGRAIARRETWLNSPAGRNSSKAEAAKND